MRHHLLAGTLLFLLASPSALRAQAPAAPDSATSVLSDIAFLASDALEGRGSGTRGNEQAAEFIAGRFRRLGLLPLFGDPACGAAAGCPRSYLQPFVLEREVAFRFGLGRDARTANVGAVLPGSDPALRGEYVVIGAHFDHIGRSPVASRDPHLPNAIRNGADDNASGTAAMMELARRLAARPPRRSVVFVGFSGEEMGLLGSEHWVRNPPVPLDSVVAMLNLDMVGYLRDRLTVRGTSTAPGLRALVDSANAAGPRLRLNAGGSTGRNSDHASFADAGLPALHFFTGTHPHYHAATDDVERINAAGIGQVVELVEAVSRAIAGRDERLKPARGRRR